MPVYFPETKTLFPIWPVIDSIKALYLFGATVVVVLLPKALGIIAALARPITGSRQPPSRLLAGALVETVFSILLAPILMLTQTRAIVEILLGRDSGWSAQRRESGASQVAALLRFHWGHMLVGAMLALACLLASWQVAAWMGPIIIGLVLSAGLSLFTSKSAPAWLSRALTTPEEANPPPIVAAVAARQAEWSALLTTKAAQSETESIASAPLR